MTLEPLYTVEEACKFLKVSRQTLYRYMDDGLLEYVEIPAGRRFRREHLEGLLSKSKGSSKGSSKPVKASGKRSKNSGEDK